MKYIKGKSGLIIPDHTEYISTGKRDNHESLEKIKKNFSIDNPFQNAKQIYDVIHQSNAVIMPYKERYQFLQSLKNDMINVTNKMKAMFTENEVLDNKSKYIIDIIYAVKFEMLVGYKIVVDSCFSRFFYNKKIILDSLHHAMYYANRILYSALKVHFTTPNGIWLDIHSLYTVSERMGLAKKQLTVSFANQQLTTLLDIYKNLLLFSILDTTRFKKQTISKLQFLTSTWAPLLEFTTNFKEDTTLYFVAPNQDCEPKLITAMESHRENGFYLDLTKVNDRLTKLIKYHANSEPKNNVFKFNEVELSFPLYSLDKILKLWSVAYCRKQERKKIIQRVRVCVGLTSLFEHINNGRSKSKSNNSTIESLTEFSEVQEINLDLLSLPEENTLELKSLIATTQPIYTAQTVDLNEGGCCLKWKESIASNLKSGEIVAIEMEEEAGIPVILIGVVRWLKNEKHSLLTGIEFISKNASPVLAKITANDGSRFLPSLLIAEQVDNNKETYTLITNKHPFLSGNQVDIKYGSENIEANLITEKNISYIYKKFSIDIVSGMAEIQHIKQAAMAQQFYAPP